ncbi:hypothetical protein D3C73_716250 [compost metagenome]
MGIGLEQGLVFVLAVNVDQQLAQRLEVAKRAGRAVDVAARTSFGCDDPAQDARAVVFEVAFGQPGAGFRNVDQIEGGQDIGLVGAGADHAAVGTITQGKAQRVEHDRLARAGFSGDHAHPAIEFEIEMFNDGVVVYGQVHQHMGRSQVLGLVIYTVFCFGLTMPLVSSIRSDRRKPYRDRE